MRTPITHLAAAAFSLAAVTLSPACATTSVFVAEDSSYHIELAPRMGVREGDGKLVADHFDLDARITISRVTTSATDLDGYIETELDATTVAAGDRSDTMVGPLPAVRLEFHGGVDLGRGFPTVPNLVVYLVMDGSTVYRLGCSAPDGPFDDFCVGTFDDVVASFALGPA